MKNDGERLRIELSSGEKKRSRMKMQNYKSGFKLQEPSLSWYLLV